jgi:hypothetical protein
VSCIQLSVIRSVPPYEPDIPLVIPHYHNSRVSNTIERQDVATFMSLQARWISIEVERAVYDADLDVSSIQNYDRRSIDKL